MVHHKKKTSILFVGLMVMIVVMESDFQFGSGETLTMCVERERQALLGFKQGLVDNYGALSSWGSDDHKRECCKWRGVRCSNTTGHVTALLLQGLSLGGKISPSLTELHHLSELYLSGNHLSGRIPPQLGNLTNLKRLNLVGSPLWSENLYWLSRLSLLSRIYLFGANISDTNWLQHVLQLPSLQELYLTNCKLTDHAPRSSARLFDNSSASLSSLYLSRNQLTSSTLHLLLLNLSTSVVSLDMSENKLDGPIPDALGRLTSLQFLYLDHNKLEGGIPISLGNFSHVQSLDLWDNDLGVPFEELLGNLSSTQMMVLFLSNTRLTGSIPVASLGRFSKLECLDLSSNSLQGTISEAHFITLDNLKELDLSSNSLTLDLSPDWIPPFRLEAILLARCNIGPSFPTWLQTQRDYSMLDLSNNGILDEVPKWFWNLTTYISYLNLSHNQMSGTIPDLSSNSVYRIDVSSNKFSGPLPLLYPNTWVVQLSQNRFSGSNISPFICTFTNRDFMVLDLSDNQLEGMFPNCWEKITGLVVLNLNNNNLSGGVPQSLGSLSNLKTLHLRGNNLSGELPPSLKNCRLLQLIDIGGNQLTGTIPPWLGELYSNMKYLSLRRNRFYGGIPLEICKLAMIQMLDLSENNISGKIPQCFNNFTSLISTNRTTITAIRNPIDENDYVDYANVHWKHQESNYKNTLGLLKLIDLSSNKLVGSIPKAFSNMRGLVSLNLSRNSLTGNMDSNIGEMEMLESLDLSRNQLCGEIPIGLAQLHFLSVLDLANNNLSGKIPLGTQLQSFNESAFGGNSKLCGKPLELCPDLPTVGEDVKEENDGLFGLSFMQEVGISLAFGFIVGFWGAVASLLMKKSWRSAFFNLFDVIGDWLFVTTTLFLNKFRRK